MSVIWIRYNVMTYCSRYHFRNNLWTIHCKSKTCNIIGTQQMKWMVRIPAVFYQYSYLFLYWSKQIAVQQQEHNTGISFAQYLHTVLRNILQYLHNTLITCLSPYTILDTLYHFVIITHHWNHYSFKYCTINNVKRTKCKQILYFLVV